MTTAVVLDIEGTTSPISSVRDALFGYTRERIPSWLRAHRGIAAADILHATAQYAGRAALTEDEAVAMLHNWIDADVKADPLKTLQGLICHDGFLAGELHGHFFPDVPPALRGWYEAGIRVYVYSSGSARNQFDWFAYAEDGPLHHLVDGYFDLTNAGSKLASESYQRITAAIGVAPPRTLFLSDAPEELDAANAAGWAVCGVTRPGEPIRPVTPHRWIQSFDELAPTVPMA